MEEIDAIKQIDDTLGQLSDNLVQKRVLAWAYAKYMSEQHTPTLKEFSTSTPPEPQDNTPALADFTTFGEALGNSVSKTDKERALFAAAYIQEVQSKTELTAREINNELKHTGFAITNITRALKKLAKERPAPLIQVKKGRYKVTSHGIEEAKKLLTDFNQQAQGGVAEQGNATD